MSHLSEEFAENLNNLLATLRTMKASGSHIDGVPTEMLFNFARSEISGLRQGTQVGKECKKCVGAECCVLPPAIVPAQGLDGGVVRPLRYIATYKEQPCWWLRQRENGFKCVLHDSGEKPFTCYAFTCGSREALRKKIREKEEDNGGSM